MSDGTWKDEEELHARVSRGRFTEQEVAAIRSEGERVPAERPSPTGREDWQPDLSRPVPELPRA
jgi:hypothetical protein